MKDNSSLKYSLHSVARLSFFSEKLPPRISLFFITIAVQLIASGTAGAAFVLRSGRLWLLSTSIWTLWFVMLFLVVFPGTDKFLRSNPRHLNILISMIFLAILFCGILELIAFTAFFPRYLSSIPNQSLRSLVEELGNGFQYTDGTALCHQAVDNLLAGKNPYANPNITEALQKYSVDSFRVTPLRTGAFAAIFPYPSRSQLEQIEKSASQDLSVPPEIETKFSYPAGSFLLPLPFITAGVRDLRWVYALFIIAGLICTTILIPSQKRLLFIGACLISLELWNSLAGGETSCLVFPLLLIAWITANRYKWISLIFLGLAAATKQTVWLFLPFYFILLYRRTDLKTTFSGLLVVAGIFALFNAYFILANPALWIESILAPFIDPMFPLGVGLITLVTSGMMPSIPPIFFTILEAVIFLASIIWYYFAGFKYPNSAVILAILPFFFGWRSLWSYFFYASIILLAGILCDNNQPAYSDAN